MTGQQHEFSSINAHDSKSVLSLLVNKTCVSETRMPPAATKSNMAKISKSYILTLHHPQGHGMSVKCEEPLYEITVQVWLLYHHSNFKYCPLFESRKELRTDRLTNGQTDDPITRCPQRTCQAGGITKMCYNIYCSCFMYVIDTFEREK